MKPVWCSVSAVSGVVPSLRRLYQQLRGWGRAGAVVAIGALAACKKKKKVEIVDAVLQVTTGALTIVSVIAPVQYLLFQAPLFTAALT